MDPLFAAGPVGSRCKTPKFHASRHTGTLNGRKNDNNKVEKKNVKRRTGGISVSVARGFAASQ